MLASKRRQTLERAISSCSAVNLPLFLVPALQNHKPRFFSATSNRPSKLGRTPISIPPGVELSVGDLHVKKDPTKWFEVFKRTVTVTGPLGKLDLEIEPFIKIEQDPLTRTAVVGIEDQSLKKQKEMWGTTWAYIQRYIMGVSEGHTAILRLVGVGYRASVEERPLKAEYPGQKFLCMKLGFTHPVEVAVPRGVTASTTAPTRVLLEGINREEVMGFAGRIRKWRPPEPYKGKGIYINDQTIKLKQKKIK